MKLRLFLLLLATMAYCCRDGARAQNPLTVPFPPSGPLASGAGGTICYLDPQAAAASFTRGPFLALVWYTPFSSCQIESYQGADRPRQLIPLYTTSSLITMSLSTLQTTGIEVWCMTNPPTIDYPIRLIVPAAVREQRTQAQTIVSGSQGQIVATGPINETPIWTPVNPVPQPGSTPWAAYIVTYPLWNAQDPTCSGNPSIAFTSNSLTLGEVRTGVQVLVVF